MNEQERLLELGRFLRDRRARITPAEANLPSGPRRRVQGLRREEVAALAGIGESWYTALENGTAPGVTETTLLAVADALHLSESEREYVRDLIDPLEAPDPSGPPDPLVVETMKAMMFPAYIISGAWDVIASNEAFRRVWAVDEREMPFNAIERLFLHPAARSLHAQNFEANIRPVIAMLRSTHGRRLYWEGLRHLRDRLIADDVIRAIWEEYEIVSPLLSNSCTIDSSFGEFTYKALTLPIPGTSHALVVQVPDDASRKRLAGVKRCDSR
jgi:transcriptional regulator with XRE-family HTH domain